jgi:hypothetical protein
VITPPTPPVDPGDTRVITSAIDTQLTNFQNQRANLGGASELQFSTTVTILAGAGASSPLAYTGFLSLLGVTVAHRVSIGKGWRVRRAASHCGLPTAPFLSFSGTLLRSFKFVLLNFSISSNDRHT